MLCVVSQILAQVRKSRKKLTIISKLFKIFLKVGIAIGGLSALAPERLNLFSKLAFKAMIAGNITNFISGFKIIFLKVKKRF